MQVCQRLCCKKPAVARAEYLLVCIGLTKAGKTTLMSVLCNENTDDITATTGNFMCFKISFIWCITRHNILIVRFIP